MNFNPNNYTSTTGNLYNETKYNNENLNRDLYNTTQNFQDYKGSPINTSSMISGNTTSYEITDKNTFHNHFIRNNNENQSFERRQQIVEEIKNEYLNKEPNYIIQENIIRNDYKSNNPILINNKNNQDDNDDLVHLTSKKFINVEENNQEEKKENTLNKFPDKNINNNIINNNNNEINTQINNSNQINNRNEKINIPLKDNNVTTQFKVIFPKEKKGIEELNDVTEERTENYISMENEINKITESIEKEKTNDNKKNIKKNKNKNEKKEKKSKSKGKKKKYFDSSKLNNQKIVPSFKYFSSLEELNPYSNEEKIIKLFENNLNLYQELVEAKNKIEILNEELRRKEGESEDKFRGYLLDENDKLSKKNIENERVIDYLLRKLNMKKKPKRTKNNSKIYNYNDIKNEVKNERRSNSGKKYYNTNIFNEYNNTSLIKSNNYENDFSNSNINIVHHKHKKKKSSSKLKSPRKVKSPKRELSLADLDNNDIIEERKKKRIKTSKNSKGHRMMRNYNNTDFFDYYNSKGVDRTKTCYACLFGNSNYYKGYSPIACSPNYK